MKRNNLFFIILFAFAITACKTNSATGQNESKKKEFGAAFEAIKVVTYDDLLSQLKETEEIKDVVVEGKVDGVCQAKGCWMNIVSPTAGSESMFVKFEDYGFFMPLDLSGSTVIMKGRAYKEETSVDELRHYAEDEGKSEEEIAAITEPVTELKFMATGVKIKE